MKTRPNTQLISLPSRAITLKKLMIKQKYTLRLEKYYNAFESLREGILIMKKVCWLTAIVLIVVFVTYIALMSMFEDPICIDLTDQVQLSIEDHTLILPWYLRIGISYDCKFNGSDKSGQSFTEFIYALPEAFESAELHCVVCWETQNVIAFVGDSRAMFVVDETFPSIQWE